MQNKSKWLTILFSCCPGAGHMYLGLMNQGIRLMTGFFLAIFLMGWLGISLIGFLIPVIWCYSVFSAYHIYETGEIEEVRDYSSLFPFLLDHSKWLGWGLIIFGVIILSERLLLPLINWQMQEYLRTGLVAVLFILGGIKLLRGDKAEIPPAGEEADTCEPGE